VPERGHESGQEAETAPGLYVQASVPDDGAGGEVDVPVVACTAEEQGTGLAAFAPGLGGMRAVVERIDAGAMGAQEFVQPFVDAVDIVPGVEPPLDPRLVGHADHEVAVVVGERERVPDAPEQLEPVRFAKVVEVRVERSVAVDEQGAAERSRTRTLGPAIGHRFAELRDGIRVHPSVPFSLTVGAADPELADLRSGLSAALDSALIPLRESEEPLGLLFSGGVDSSLLAWELRRRPNVLLCTLGNEGTADHAAARSGAGRLGLPWQPLFVSPSGVTDAQARYAAELDGVPEVSRIVLLSLALAIDLTPRGNLVCGQGADELFLGYAHYRGLSADDAARRSSDDLDRLERTDWPRTRRIAEKAGKHIFAPFLSREFVDRSLRVPIERRLPGPVPKAFFREWAVERGLPSELAARPKKALQYGSGVAALVRKGR
jgi:Asparagine synthase